MKVINVTKLETNADDEKFGCMREMVKEDKVHQNSIREKRKLFTVLTVSCEHGNQSI